MDTTRTTTPTAISPAILDLCKRITGGQPFYVPIVPETGAVVNNCFPDVAARVVRDGGELIHGWAIWEWAGAYVEGEFHAVWKSPAGDFVDIIPKPPGVTRVLFLPDPVRRFEGFRVDNRRMPTTTDMLVHEYIGAIAEFERLTGNKVGENRVKVTPELRHVAQQAIRLQEEMYRRY